jgi:uncharacterized protein YabE (DUF348 family)
MKLLDLCTRLLVTPRVGIFVALFASIVIGTGTVLAVSPDNAANGDDQHIVTIYDQGEKRVVLTRAQTVEATLAQAGISLATHDRVEPGLKTEYAAQNYTVNIYRAHPVTIIDGMKREQVLTPRTTAKDIAKEAGINVQDEDILKLEQATNVLADGMGTRLVIDRATPVNVVLYGAQSQMYTQADDIAGFLEEHDIVLAANDTISVGKQTAISKNMTIEIWRDGAQTATVEEEIAFSVRQVMAVDRPVGFREVQTPGVAGKKKVVYEIVREQGKEVSRKVIQEVVLSDPKEQVELVGNKGANPLTKSKGAHHFVDSKGVSHRETYYDLPMNVVMGACGGGEYTVREDGAKVDAEGYILIAANLGNYPRCSIVETSMGLGRVYDTGGFAVKHPHGFDLATDWTNGDGR